MHGCMGSDNFLILTFLKLFLNNPWQTLFAPGDPFGRAWRRGAAASLCRATPSGAAAPGHQGPRGPFLLPPSFLLSQPKAAPPLTAAASPPPFRSQID
jgi:hypothetical protein